MSLVGEGSNPDIADLDEAEIKKRLGQLTRQRGGKKSMLTRFQRYLSNIPETGLGPSVINELESRIARLDVCYGEYHRIQDEIEIYSDKPEQQLDSDSDDFDVTYFSVVAKANHILSNQNKSDSNGDSSSHSDLNSNNHGNTQVNQASQVNSGTISRMRLPQIELPKFSGGFSAWVEFRDTYVSLIHSDRSIPNIQKFHYLRGSLEGDASQVIKSIEIAGNNYENAWKLIRDRYDNTRLLTHNHLKSLFELPAIQRESSTRLRELVDSISRHVGTLTTLGQATENWDAILLHLFTTKLDIHTTREWEVKIQYDDNPTLDSFIRFLRNRATVLESVETKRADKQSVEVKRSNNFSNKKLIRNAQSFAVVNSKCAICDGTHYIYSCDRFKNLSIQERIEKIRSLHWCLNCLRPGHSSGDCRSSSRCKQCGSKHNTILHLPNSRHVNERNSRAGMETSHAERENAQGDAPAVNAFTMVAMPAVAQVCNALLPTVTILMEGRNQSSHIARALLDSGSQANFITSELTSRLGLITQNNTLNLSGIAQTESSIQTSCRVTIKSRLSKFKASFTCYVLRSITQSLPSYSFEPLNVPAHIQFADPGYNVPGPIDLLIGAEIFWDLIRTERIRVGPKLPIYQNTTLGWIVSGRAPNMSNQTAAHFACVQDVQNQLSKFWELEECLETKKWNSEEQMCEDHFKSTICKNEQGRFIVKMPLREDASRLGNSKDHAIKRFLKLEARLMRNPSLYTEYKQFMREYISLHHMTETDNNENLNSYYLPHHPVVKTDRDTTKVRVVFDASAKTSSGLSLNDIQYVGPVIQDTLFAILLRFRIHNHVISADIVKMYRQIEMSAPHRKLQKVVWREKSSDALKYYELNTLTYGTAAASFQAIRCLHEVAHEIERLEPSVARIILHDFYVDDLLSGAKTVEQAVELCNKIDYHLSKSCLPLSKWVSNTPSVINKFKRIDPSKELDLGKGEQSKTLGLLWASKGDNLSYKVNATTNSQIPTKRILLSTISQIFDPLGLVSPVTIKAKMLLQRLWLEGIDWDEPISSDLQERWHAFYSQLSKIKDLELPRQVVLAEYRDLQLHGFSDASELAYGACIYMRTTLKNHTAVRLLVAKSKVAPLKTQTIPRLELCASHLLAKLYKSVTRALNVEINKTYLWTDSTVVLGWLKTYPSLLKTFVSHRVAEIQSITLNATWRHVRSEHNPADILSRGMNPSDIKSCNQWWNGPVWLNKPELNWPISTKYDLTNLPESKTNVAVSMTTISKQSLINIEDYSCLNKIESIIAYVFRFLHNARHKGARRTGPLSHSERSQAMMYLVKEAQQSSFTKEIESIARSRDVKAHSVLSALCPFLDEQGVLRVGGRLTFSNFSYTKKHPILLCSKHTLSKLIAHREHLRQLHIGPQGLLSVLRNRYWITSGRNLTRKIVHDCIICFRVSPRFIQPIMGNLPLARVSPSYPFAHSGVDYAGPIMLKTTNKRGCKTYKAYIGVFVCLATKAVHLELITALTTEAFIAALRRFTSRRGIPQDVYSDNGTNFVGAQSELKDLFKFLKSESDDIAKQVAKEQFAWHFSPARAPHFGGIWEAGVKSVKNHLKRVVADRTLTYEDYSTLLIQIEGVLNSRPLSAMSSDPNDLTPLTPAHFLIGRPMVAVADPDLSHILDGRLSSYQRIQHMVQHFWARWSREYIHQMQTRAKWRRQLEAPMIMEGTLALIADDSKPIMHWKMGRIVQTHPGKDGIVRVVTLRTTNGCLRRAVTKICPLPID